RRCPGSCATTENGKNGFRVVSWNLRTESYNEQYSKGADSLQLTAHSAQIIARTRRLWEFGHSAIEQDAIATFRHNIALLRNPCSCKLSAVHCPPSQPHPDSRTPSFLTHTASSLPVAHRHPIHGTIAGAPIVVLFHCPCPSPFDTPAATLDLSAYARPPGYPETRIHARLARLRPRGSARPA